MLGFLRGLFSAIGELFGFLKDRQLIDAGRAVQEAKAQEEVLEHVDKAKQVAAAAPDPGRDRRLRRRFDRAADDSDR